MSKTIELAIGVSTTPISVLPIPIKQPRDPDARDFGYAVGQLWFNTVTFFLWIQDGIINELPNWVLIANSDAKNVATTTGPPGVSLTNNVAATIASINLTPGNWAISLTALLGGIVTGTQFVASISTTDNTLSADNGLTLVATPTMSTASSNESLTIPSYYVSIATNTTFYYVARVQFSVGPAFAYGTISAISV